MKVLGQPVSSMYIWAVLLLSVLAAVSAYSLGTFPGPLIIAVAASGVADILFSSFYLRYPLRIPFSGLITGLIIGSVAPINSPLLLVLLASLIAIASKFLIKYRSSNIFNPAAIGLMVALSIFGLGDDWWAASSYNLFGTVVTLAPILIILPYEAKRLPTALTFLSTSIIITLITGTFGPISSNSLVAALFSINYLFAFVMLVEPKTSPTNRYAQVAYGVAVAILFPLLSSLKVTHPILVSLLVGNILYAFYRAAGKR